MEKRQFAEMKSASLSSLMLASLISLSLISGAIFIHNQEVGAWLFSACFLLAAFLAGFGLERHPPLLLTRKLWTVERRYRGQWGASLVLAMLLAIIARSSDHMPLLPITLERFVLLSMAIGATEEIVFRGVIYGEAARWNERGAILLSACAFAAFKALLFIRTSPENLANPWTVFLFTLPAGILLGLVRRSTGSLIPALTAHMLFDLILYGDSVKAPWWVWG